MPEHVTILGDGAMATVCSILLTQGGYGVTIWGAFEESIDRLIQNRENQRLLPGVRVPAGVHLTANDADCFAAPPPTLILSAVPTQYMRSVWTRLAPHVPAGVPIVSVAKGIEVGTLLRPSQIIADCLGNPPRITSWRCSRVRISPRRSPSICRPPPSPRRRIRRWPSTCSKSSARSGFAYIPTKT